MAGRSSACILQLKDRLAYQSHPTVCLVIDGFVSYSKSWEKQFDAEALAASAEWQMLTKWILEQLETVKSRETGSVTLRAETSENTI